VAGLASPAHSASRPVPQAPLATSASTGVGTSLITWKERHRARVSGYNVFVGAAPDQEWPVPVNGTTPVAGTSYLVTGLTAGQTYYFTVQAVGAGGQSPVSNEVSATPVSAYVPLGALPGPVAGMAATADGSGYWVVTSSGTVSAHGSAQDYGSPASLDLAAPIVQIVSTPDGKGYWLVAADGGLFAYGDASYEGSVAGLQINAPIVGMAATADGKGYWLLGADGGVFALGDAAFLGSLAGAPASSGSAPLSGMLGLPTPTPTSPQSAGIAADPATDGYWVVMADGTVAGFGAPNLGPQAGAFPVDTVLGITASPGGKGYWEVTRSGGVYAYGNAPFHGSAGAVPLDTPVSGMAVDSASGGYWLIGLDGGVFAFDAPFHGAG
jgi:Fibronectin type III domain